MFLTFMWIGPAKQEVVNTLGTLVTNTHFRSWKIMCEIIMCGDVSFRGNENYLNLEPCAIKKTFVLVLLVGLFGLQWQHLSCSNSLISWHRLVLEMTTNLSPWSYQGKCNRYMNITHRCRDGDYALSQKYGINLAKNLLATVTDGYQNISSK